MRFKILVVITVLIFTQTVIAQQNQEEEIKGVLSLFFKGLQSGDTLIIKQTISNELKLQTTFKNKEGKPILRNIAVSEFLNSVALKNPKDSWDERLISYHIQTDGNMANVWTPYEFYLNNDFSHCGVNSFQLFFDGEHWKIIYIIDTRRKQDCKK